MPKDLTAITTPYGLLDPETQRALREHGGPWEFYDGKKWCCVKSPSWDLIFAYRVKPAPSKPREWWLVDPALRPSFVVFRSLDDAVHHGWKTEDLIHVREVIE